MRLRLLPEGVTPVARTLVPTASNWRVIAAPMPLVAPVTRAVAGGHRSPVADRSRSVEALTWRTGDRMPVSR